MYGDEDEGERSEKMKCVRSQTRDDRASSLRRSVSVFQEAKKCVSSHFTSLLFFFWYIHVKLYRSAAAVKKDDILGSLGWFFRRHEALRLDENRKKTSHIAECKQSNKERLVGWSYQLKIFRLSRHFKQFAAFLFSSRSSLLTHTRNGDFLNLN